MGSSSRPTSAARPGSAPLATVLACLFAAPAASFDLTIVHWNDVHARNTPVNKETRDLCLEDAYTDPLCYGGHARIATVCQEAKAANPATLCIDAGDAFWGSEWDLLYESTETGAVLDAVGTDAMVVGNHEFDYGVSVLASFVDGVSFPVLGACNMDTSGEPSLNVVKWQVFELEGVKVALLGYTLRATGTTTFVGSVVFDDPVSAVPQCIQDFMETEEAEGVDIIGLVSHAGIETDIEVAEKAVRADFIISAHTHTAMFPDLVGPCLEWTDGECTSQDTSEYEYPHMVGDVPIFQQFWAGKYAGVATLTFDDSGGLTSTAAEAIPLGTYYSDTGEPITVEEAESVTALQVTGFEVVTEFAVAEVAALADPLAARSPDINMQETPLGNIIADAMIHGLAEDGLRNFEESAGTPLVSVFDSNNIQDRVPAGSFTFVEAKVAFPFGGFVVVLEITGATLRAALEVAYDSVTDDDPPGKFLHVGGGLTVVVDSTQAVGERVQSMQHDCVDIADADTVHVATNNFAAAGNSEYEPLQGADRVVVLGPDLSTAFADYLAANTAADGTVDAALLTTDGRYADLADTTVTPKCEVDGATDTPTPAGVFSTIQFPQAPLVEEA